MLNKDGLNDGKTDIIITVINGLVDIIKKPTGINVFKIDYDIEGCDPDRIEQDPVGENCFIIQYTPDKIQECQWNL